MNPRKSRPHPSAPGGRYRIALAALLTLAAAVATIQPAPASAAPGSDLASDLIAAVNAFRAANGMGPLLVDPILMLVEQAQNTYSLSIGAISHYGPTGARPRERAAAAGYGGGKTFFASENIAMGSGLTPQGAVEMWTGDAPHLNTMLGQYYRDVGAGAGEDDGVFYYNLLTAYIAGGISARSTVPAGGIDLPGANPGRPVVKATAAEDGSIVHVVEAGQTLWTIAAVYGVGVDDLLALNGLSGQALLHPGDRIAVRPASPATFTPAPSATVGPTVTASLRATRRPTSTATPTSTPPAVELDSTTLFGAWAAVMLILGLVLALRRR